MLFKATQIFLFAVILIVFPYQFLIANEDIERQLTAQIIQRICYPNSKAIIFKDRVVDEYTTLPRKKNAIKQIIVVIDPGHGGHDGGSFNIIANLKEKNITLQVAKQLQCCINRFSKFQAILTRQDDTFIPLRERLKIAKAHQADLFLSIHADSYIHARAQGASVFTLSLQGATSEAAKWLSEKENYAELGGVSLKEQDTLLRSVLINLTQTVVMTQSVVAGQFILKELGKVTHLHQNTVEKGSFIVLKSPDIPSVLIEVGFLSNPIEAYQLSSKAYQARVSQAIAQGVYQYFQTIHKNNVTKSL